MQKNSDSLAVRLRAIRLELFGELGIKTLAQAMAIPDRTWDNYELGVTIPGDLMLRFLELTGANPHWLLTGEGDRYRDRPADKSRLASP